jgi:hypothetical protein
MPAVRSQKSAAASHIATILPHILKAISLRLRSAGCIALSLDSNTLEHFERALQLNIHTNVN